MNFEGFKAADFDVFEVDGLEARMDCLKATLRPKLEQIGADLVPFLSQATGQPMYAHVAKHARRKTNPPKDSWVAWSHHPRGYKMFPHFQVGAWSTHVFVQWGIIYESPHKSHFGQKMVVSSDELLQAVPASYRWYPDHTVNVGTLTSELTQDELLRLSHRLINQKNGELMVGTQVPREEALQMKPETFLQFAQDTFKHLIVLHRAAMSFTEEVGVKG